MGVAFAPDFQGVLKPTDEGTRMSIGESAAPCMVILPLSTSDRIQPGRRAPHLAAAVGAGLTTCGTGAGDGEGASERSAALTAARLQLVEGL